MNSTPRPGPSGGFYRTSVWSVIDQAKTSDSAQATIWRAADDCRTWGDAIELVGEFLVREWLPDGGRVSDPLPEIARAQVARTALNRWRHRKQQQVVQDAVAEAIKTVVNENAKIGVQLDRAAAVAHIARWVSPQK